MIKVTIETKLPKKLLHILQSIGYWNQEGTKVYEGNKAGTIGSFNTQALANQLCKEKFILLCLIDELTTFSTSKETGYWPAGFKFGRSGSHIWIANAENVRTLLIHF